MDALYAATSEVLNLTISKKTSHRSAVYQSSFKYIGVGVLDILLMDSKRPVREDPSGSGDLFGNRYLESSDDVFSHNAWDEVEFTEEKLAEIAEIIERQRNSAAENGDEIIQNTAQSWDSFYGTHSANFFKDRKWLLKEFPEIFREPEDKRKTYALEVGSGPGNSTFPILESTQSSNPNLFIYSCDFSPTAVNLIRQNEKFDANRCLPFVWDITKSDAEIPVKEGSLDYVLCVYVLSALPPEKHKTAIENLVRLMKNGAFIYIKDYGRNDLTQLRFKKGRYLQENLYSRADGTLSYFFEANELDDLLTAAGLTKNKKQLLRLTCEVLKNRAYLEKILDSQNVMRHFTRSQRLVDDRTFCLILLYELIFGIGIRVANKEIKQILVGAKKDILYEHEQLAADNILPESLAPKSESAFIPRYARINTLNASVEDVLEQLKQDGFILIEDVRKKQKAFNETVQRMKKNEFFFDINLNDLLVFHPKIDLHDYGLVENMALILQDKASCLPAFLLEVDPNSEVLDSCAAPGMKTSHLAALMENKGKIWAIERDRKRCEILEERLEHSGTTNTEIICGDFLRENTTSEDYAKVRFALVDAPCSGSGMVKRNDFLEEKVDQKRVESLANLQSMLLKHALKIPNLERLVYSTCSINVEENEGVVQEALNAFGDRFELVEPKIKWKTRGVGEYEFASKCLRAYPEKNLSNGFFIAIFQAK